MAIFHLYYLRDGKLVDSGDIEAEDEAQAAEMARTQGLGDVVEIWNAHSRVRILKPNGDPLAV